MLRAVDIPVLMSGVFLLGLTILRGAVDTDVEDRATPERRERKLLGESFGEGLVEPWDSESRFSSRMVWRDAPERWPTWSMLMAGGGWSAIWF